MRKIFLFLFLLLILNVFSYTYIENTILYPGENIKIKGYNEDSVILKLYNILDPMEVFYKEKKINELNKELIYTKKIKFKDNNYSEKINNEGVYLLELQGKEITNYNIIIVRSIDFISIYDGEYLKIKIIDLKNGILSNADIYLVDDFGEVINYKNISDLEIKIKNLKKIIAKKHNSYAIKNIYNPYKTYGNNKIIIITDKPIYKPGDELHIKIHLFENKDNIYMPSKNKKILLKLKGPNDLELFNNEIITDEFGGVSYDYVLNKELPIGYYSLNVLYEGEEEYYGFYIQNYIKPEYQIFLSSDKEYYFSNEIINYKIKLKYYNEEPVNNAQVAYYIRYFPINSNDQKLVYQGISFTNENGEILLPIKVQSEHNGYYVIQIVTIDESQRQMEDEYSVKVYNGNYLIKTDKYYYQSKLNSEFTISGIVSDINNIPVSGNIKIEIFDNSNNIISSSSYSFDGKFDIPILLKKEGSYKIKLSYDDAYVYVYSYASLYQEEKGIKYKIDNNTIKILDFNGYVFLCGRKLYDEGNILEIPESPLERNLFLISFYVENYKIIKNIQTVNLKQNRNLNFYIKLSKDSYTPKEMVDLEIISNEDAEFTLSVVDESIFSLVDYKFDLEKSLYSELYYPDIIIDSSNQYFFYNNRVSLKQSKNILASTKVVNSQKVNTREFFPDTALWLSAIKTKNGYAKISFKNPDSITSFRVTVNGVSNGKIGTKIDKYISNKDFYIRPILPKFAIKGDFIEFPVVIYNNMKKDLKINYYIDSKFDISPKSGVMDIKKNSNKVIKFILNANKAEEYPIVFNFEKDIVKLNLKVYDNILKRNEKEIVQGKEGEIFNIKKIIDDNINELLEFPYMCTEQSVSSVISGINEDKIQKKLNDVIFRLYKYQNIDGGWGWWPNDKSDTYITTYVLELFYYIKNMTNVNINKNIIDNGLKYLLSEFQNSNYKGYVWYILKLYNIDLNIIPENELDLLFYSFFNNNAFNNLLEKIVIVNDIAYLEYYEDYFVSNIELNSWLLKLLTEKNEKELSFKVLKYLLLNKWYSTKDKARVNMALFDFSNLEFNNLKIIDKMNIDKEYVNKGIKIEKILYKNYPMIISQDKRNYLIDSFMPLNKNFIPENVEILSVGILERRGNEYIWLYKGKDEKFQLFNIFFEIIKGEVFANNINYGYPYSLRSVNKKIYLHTSKGLFEIVSNKKIDENIKDFAIYNNRIIILKNNKLILDDKTIELNKDFRYVDVFNNNIYLFNDSMYMLNNEKLEYVFPISAYRVLNNNIYYGSVKFEGNSMPISNFGKFKILFKKGKHNIYLSDIIKTKIQFISEIPAYLIFEDPYIGSSQILTNYNENTIKPSYKFYYNWYNNWIYWYSAYQINKNKISFFANGFKNGIFEYYWKPTLPGRYTLLHTVGYSMYWSGIYGSSKIIYIDILDN
ncbi:MG2 domain-containing protein [Marinitoga sp. 38H-ov]|uniref:MG2 domain-containing protein n=1 Tax=Marinitoga sp. 38H-ov TaxID=1755814 RepID=UPI0013EC46EF|nr:MG2 domain-containing protein [Marinitoga sp. 38H-ov]KAF2956209.1 hypothetical protein AS160_06950 [Marinitoga sp. 38H-ov]